MWSVPLPEHECPREALGSWGRSSRGLGGGLGVGCKLSACRTCCLLEAKELLQTRCLGNSSPFCHRPRGENRSRPSPHRRTPGEVSPKGC